MDIFTAIIYIILFIIIMAIAFSMGVTSPLVGKREVAYIIAIGFVLGGIGGYFFIEPIYEEVPYAIGNVQGLFTLDNEVINLNIPSTSNISTITSKILDKNGVNSVSTNGFELKTSNMNGELQNTVSSYLNNDTTIKNFTITNNTITVDLANDESSTSTLGSLVTWLSQNGVVSEFAFVHIQVKVNANDVVEIKEDLKDKGYTVMSVEGPVQDTIRFFKVNSIPTLGIIFISGIIGIIVAVAGIYVEPVANFFRRFRKPKDTGRRRY